MYIKLKLNNSNIIHFCISQLLKLILEKQKQYFISKLAVYVNFEKFEFLWHKSLYEI